MRIYRPSRKGLVKVSKRGTIAPKVGTGLRIIPVTLDRKTKAIPTLQRLKPINFRG